MEISIDILFSRDFQSTLHYTPESWISNEFNIPQSTKKHGI